MAEYHILLSFQEIFFIIIFCALVFIPLGFLVREYCNKFKLYYKILPNVRSNLHSKGSFKDFLNSEDPE